MREPRYRDVSYGPHERNVMDLYLVESDAPAPLYVFVHAGGFIRGDKTRIHPELLEACLEADISVAAINYRLSETDPYPAAMRDGVRALQFLRHRAKEWNLDPRRVAAGGGSAGGGIVFWIGFRKYLADPNSDDPVARESTRLTCIASWNTPSSYDPNFIRTIISGPAYTAPELQQFFRVTPDKFESLQAKKIFEEASPINNVSKDAPPTFLFYPVPNLPMTPDLDMMKGIHHPKFGQVLKKKMDKLGVECVVRFREDSPDLEREEFNARSFRELVEFVKKHIGMKK